MKNIFATSLYIFLISLPVIQFHGCSSDPVSGLGNPNLFNGYHSNDAAIMMTLSALSYTAADNKNAMEIRDSISLQLQNTNYATGGKWKIVWGPGINPTGTNLIYVAVDSTADSISYALCARGTTFNLENVFQNLNVLQMSKWPFSGSSDSIAAGSLEALDTVLNTTDPITNQSLYVFLSTLIDEKQKMYFTGHSLGGALATMLTSWFIDMGFASKFKISTYTFAAPTVGNSSFVDSYHNKMISTGSESHRCINSNDIVPYAWADLLRIVNNNIPTYVPFLIAAGIQLIHDYMVEYGIVYKHVETTKNLGTLTPNSCPNDSTFSNFQCWVAFEHSSNNYLKLLNAGTINWGRYRPEVNFIFDVNNINTLEKIR